MPVLDPASAEWSTFFLIDEGNRSTDKSDKTITILINEIINEIKTAYFPVEGRGGTQVPHPVNLIGRWLELPPEMAGEE